MVNKNKAEEESVQKVEPKEAPITFGILSVALQILRIEILAVATIITALNTIWPTNVITCSIPNTLWIPLDSHQESTNSSRHNPHYHTCTRLYYCNLHHYILHCEAVYLDPQRYNQEDPSYEVCLQSPHRKKHVQECSVLRHIIFGIAARTASVTSQSGYYRRKNLP